MVGGGGDPAPQRRPPQPGGLDKDHVLGRAAGEVHLPDVVAFEGLLGGLVSEPDHELVADDADEHVPVEQERQAAEHFPLGHIGAARYGGADAVGEVLVVGHQASRWPGRPKRGNRAGSAKPVISPMTLPSMVRTMMP